MACDYNSEQSLRLAILGHIRDLLADLEHWTEQLMQLDAETGLSDRIGGSNSTEPESLDS